MMVDRRCALEWDILIADIGCRGGLLASPRLRGGVAGRPVLLIAARAPLTAIEDDHIVGDHLRFIARLAALLVLPGARLEAALQIDAGALGEVLAADLG